MSPPLVVVPIWNERPNLPAVLRELRGLRPHDDVLVVDDGSTDGGAAAALQMGCRVLPLPFHVGYGAAVQAGLKHGLRHGHGVVVTFDGDGQHDPADIESLVRAVEAGADLAVGSRALAPEAFCGSVWRRLGRSAFARLARALTGVRLSDPTSGLKAFGPRAQELYGLARFPDRFPDVDALVLARRARLVIEERPARMRVSRNRHSMHGGVRGLAYTFNMVLSLLVAASGREADLRG